MYRAELESTALDFKRERTLRQYRFIVVTGISSAAKNIVIVTPIEKNVLQPVSYIYSWYFLS